MDELSLLDQLALAAYFTGTATDTQHAWVTRWASDAPEAYAAARTAWLLSAGPRFVPNTDIFVRRLMAQCDANIESRNGRLTVPAHRWHRATRFSRTWSTSRFAAVLAAALVITIGTIVVQRRDTTQALVAESVARRYDVPLRHRAVVRFADGTRVTLAPGSGLQVMAGERTVALNGEAYFEVNPSSKVPFVVRTGTVLTRVLGTTFNVRYYAGDPSVQVMVTSGKVVSAGSRTSVVLTAGLVGHVTDSTSSVKPHTAVADGWVSGQLVFEDEPVAMVLAALHRWYGYDFHVTDSAMTRRRIHAVFKTDEGQKTLAALADLLDATVVVNDTIVTLRSRSPNTRMSRRVRDQFSTPSEVGK